MQTQIKSYIEKNMPDQHFDSMAIGVIDFQNSSFDTYEYLNRNLYYDLASVSKVLNLATCYHLNKDLFSDEMKLLLNHRSGLPSWGLLDDKSWKSQLLSYPIKESETLYSDFGALRLMLEIEKASGKKLKDLVSEHWDSELLFWRDLTSEPCVHNCFRSGKKIIGLVHDPNAYVIESYVSHAGLFSTVKGLCQTILNLYKKVDFLSEVAQAKESHRFALGWDTIADTNNTLAGAGCGKNTFGHLGFTGTSLWIDPDKKRGVVILSNGVQNYWYDKAGLNQMRKDIGEMIWK